MDSVSSDAYRISSAGSCLVPTPSGFAFHAARSHVFANLGKSPYPYANQPTTTRPEAVRHDGSHWQLRDDGESERGISSGPVYARQPIGLEFGDRKSDRVFERTVLI